MTVGHTADEWIACADRMPAPSTMCFVSDGRGNIALVEWNKDGLEMWDVCGATGADLDLAFEPVFWLPLTIEFP